LPRRRKDKVDGNQAGIVKALRKLGFSVETGMDDLLIGKDGMTFWVELKDESAVSKVTGEILESAKKQHQKDLEREWKGHYFIAWNLEQILENIREGFSL